MLCNLIRAFPTTHVLIDDNVNYLRGLSTILPLENRIFRYFSNPKKALEWINQEYFENEKMCLVEDALDEERGHNVIDCDISHLHKSLCDEQRFYRISTVIVDYDMPSINGIDLCRSIKDPNIQKILLTGFLEEKEARHALNLRWIDMFLPKGEECSEKLSELIDFANGTYFSRVNAFISAVAKACGQNYVHSSFNVHKFFSNTLADIGAVEFYLLNTKGDYLLVDEYGTTYGLSIQDHKRRMTNIELASELDVSKESLKKLRSHKYVFCFNGEEQLPLGKDWTKYIYPAKCIDYKLDLLGCYSRRIFNKKNGHIRPFNTVLSKSMSDALSYFDQH